VTVRFLPLTTTVTPLSATTPNLLNATPLRLMIQNLQVASIPSFQRRAQSSSPFDEDSDEKNRTMVEVFEGPGMDNEVSIFILSSSELVLNI
jgi:hypothetical protein